MKEHELKTWPEFFQDITNGKKTFEIRKNDRDFKVDDVLILNEFEPCKKCMGSGRVKWYDAEFVCCESPHGKYTGKSTDVIVTYILSGAFGVSPDHVVMAIRRNL